MDHMLPWCPKHLRVPTHTNRHYYHVSNISHVTKKRYSNTLQCLDSAKLRVEQSVWCTSLWEFFSAVCVCLCLKLLSCFSSQLKPINFTARLVITQTHTHTHMSAFTRMLQMQAVYLIVVVKVRRRYFEFLELVNTAKQLQNNLLPGYSGMRITGFPI